MVILVKALGILIMGMGIAVLSNPEILKIVMNFWRQDKRIYLAGAIRLFFGIIFLMTAPACRLAGVIYTLGALMVIGGISIFVIKPALIHKMLDWWKARPPLMVRGMGLVAITLGAFILYSA